MATRLLHTKCYVPTGRGGAVSRPRLDQRLHAGLTAGRRLTLIVAPAGYGKTTLAAAWLQQAALPVVWITLDAHDNDLAQLLLSMHRLDAEAGKQIQAALDALHLPPPDELAAALLHDLEGLGPKVAHDGRCILALDDYHKIEQPQVHALLERLVEHLPPAWHLLLISREDPPLPLPRLRARAELTEIRAHDLRFTGAEVAQFFSQAMALTLTTEQLATLEERTEGWIASLHLAGLSLQGRSHEQIAAFVDAFSGSHRYIFDYLAEEVLAQQPAAVRRFLRQTAVLERFHAPLCRAVTGDDDSRAMLQRLEQAGLFLVPLDDERIWYRYHHLFADYLRSGLPAAEAAHLSARASRWCADHGLLFESVHYALASDDPDLTAAIVEQALAQAAAWSGGALATLVRWIDAVPGQVLRTRPRLSLDASRALFLSGRPALAAQMLDQAEQALQATMAPEHDTLLAAADIYRAALAALHGQVQHALALVSAAQARLPATATLIRARAADTLGLAYGLAGDLARSEQWYAEAGRLGEAAGVSYLAVNARCEAALAQIGQGHLSRAAHTCREALALVAHAPIPPAGLALTILGMIAYERHDLPAAEQQLAEGSALSRHGGLPDDLRHAHLLQARLCMARGDQDGAAGAIARAISLTPAREVPRLALLAGAWRAELDLDQGNRAAAWRWACAYEAQRRSAAPETCQDAELLALARIVLAHGEHAQAAEISDVLQRQALAAGRVRTAIAALIVLARARAAGNERPAAVAALAQALRLAAPEGFLRLFHDAGEPLAELLTAAREAAPDLVERILALQTGAAPPAGAALPGPDALSEQELRVLRLIVAGKTNQEIAAELVIAVGTAKWHVHNILQKLGVHNRPKAIARARELGLA